ncbi:DivIVA domain-containing protein [Rhodococcus sp. (in: high G+C Gram-positive bacteria)]|uniref:DivIVA domain-containing protein n=1 Tax=Rhodococcus sp. TaxID=1831 RepID=UPI001A08D4E7|nr:DivIVA domain-containing protein [Rhodococcus sp. (in: high G+C Gram-positive bacteria)]MBF0663781.1 DivIVA domain-containing protein [Rhodococcus sp. (in: high G+C Gram-positive bacteria)]
MVTVLVYVVVMVVVGAVLFFIASAVFGRSEVLAPIPPGTTTTVLPAADVTGTDVRDLRFQQTWRGYKMSEVDWALDRLAREIDDLRAELARTAGEPLPGEDSAPELHAAPENAADIEDTADTEADDRAGDASGDDAVTEEVRVVDHPEKP